MANRRTPKPGEVNIVVLAGVEGPSVYVNEIRVAGPKPWGGGRVLHEFFATRAHVDEALQQVWKAEAECYGPPS
jgi:hypothetical protein